MKKKKSWLILFLAVLLIFTLEACSSSGGNKPKSSQQSSSSSRVSAKESSSSSSSNATKKDVKMEEMQRVGSDDYGYIDIPKKWVKFTDVNGDDSIQYTDGSAYNIVTMNGYTKEKANIKER